VEALLHKNDAIGNDIAQKMGGMIDGGGVILGTPSL